MIEINLIPDVKQELIKAQRMRAAVISGSIFATIIAGSLVVLLLLYVFGVQTVRDVYLNDEIKKSAATLSQKEDLSKILTIQNQLTKIDSINQDKNMDSRIFDMVSAVTPPGEDSIKFSLITVDNAEGTIRLEGQTPGYSSMEVLRKTLTGAIIEYADGDTTKSVNLASNISTSDISYGTNSEGNKVVRFVLTFKYAEELFAQDVVAPVFKLNINGNVSDSYLGIPKSLFAERAGDL